MSAARPSRAIAATAPCEAAPERLAVADLAAAWRAEADHLDRFAPAAATAFRDAAQQLEQSLRDSAGEVLTLQEASLRSGLSVDRLRHKVAAGEIPNAGRKHAPRVRSADLPLKASKPGLSAYDPDTDARRLSGRGRAGR